MESTHELSRNSKNCRAFVCANISQLFCTRKMRCEIRSWVENATFTIVSQVLQFTSVFFGEREALLSVELLISTGCIRSTSLTLASLNSFFAHLNHRPGVGVGVCRRRRCIGHFAVSHPILKHHVIHWGTQRNRNSTRRHAGFHQKDHSPFSDGGGHSDPPKHIIGILALLQFTAPCSPRGEGHRLLCEALSHAVFRSSSTFTCSVGSSRDEVALMCSVCVLVFPRVVRCAGCLFFSGECQFLDW